MKTLLLCWCFLPTLNTTLHGATWFWDVNGSAAVCGGTGSWGSGGVQGPFWTLSCDSGAFAAWNNANVDSATFPSASAPTLTNSITVNKITTLIGVTIGGTSTLTFAGTNAGVDAQHSIGATTLTCNYTGNLLRKTGPGRLDLNNANNTMAKYYVAEGFVTVGAVNRLGTVPSTLVSDYFTFDGGGLSTSILSGDLGSTRGITIGAAGAFLGAAGSGNVMTISSPVVGTNGGGLTVTTGSPFYSAHNVGGIWVISNPANNWDGPAIVAGGILRLGSAGVVPDGSPVIVSSGTGIFDLGGFDETIGSLANSGTVTNSSLTAVVLTVGGDDTSKTNTGTIRGLLSLIKTGQGNMALNAINSYKGSTTINAGSLSIDGDATFGDGSGTLNLNGGNLIVTANRGTTANILKNPIYLAADAELIGSATSASERNAVFGGPITTTAGTLTIRNVDPTANNDSTFDVRFTNSFNFTRPIVLLANTTGNHVRLSMWNAEGAGEQAYTALISGNGSIRRAASTAGTGGKATLSGANTFSGGTFLNDGEISLGVDSTGPPDAPTAGPLGTGPLHFGGNTCKLSGSGGARVVGNHIQVDSSPVRFIGTEDLELSGSVDLGANSRTFHVENLPLITFSGVLTNGGLIKNGNGILALTASNLYEQPTTISEGTLLLAGVGAIPNSAHISVDKLATLDVSQRLDGTLSLSSGQEMSGNGTVLGSVRVEAGSILAPGSSSGKLTTGNQTWSGGGSYVWEINNGSGAAGADPGWDLLSIEGGLDLGAAPGNKFTIKVVSLLTNSPGPAENFDPSTNSSWPIASASAGVSNFNAAAFSIDASAFINATGGVFSVALQNGTNLVISYEPPADQKLQIVGLSPHVDGNVHITFAGQPGLDYLVQAATNLAFPVTWETLTNNLNGGILFTAATNGLWNHTDLNATSYTSRYYRAHTP